MLVHVAFKNSNILEEKEEEDTFLHIIPFQDDTPCVCLCVFDFIGFITNDVAAFEHDPLEVALGSQRRWGRLSSRGGAVNVSGRQTVFRRPKTDGDGVEVTSFSTSTERRVTQVVGDKLSAEHFEWNSSCRLQRSDCEVHWLCFTWKKVLKIDTLLQRSRELDVCLLFTSFQKTHFNPSSIEECCICRSIFML